MMVVRVRSRSAVMHGRRAADRLMSAMRLRECTDGDCRYTERNYQFLVHFSFLSESAYLAVT
jgi:hypothetical protein